MNKKTVTLLILISIPICLIGILAFFIIISNVALAQEERNMSAIELEKKDLCYKIQNIANKYDTLEGIIEGEDIIAKEKTSIFYQADMNKKNLYYKETITKKNITKTTDRIVKNKKLYIINYDTSEYIEADIPKIMIIIENLRKIWPKNKIQMLGNGLNDFTSPLVDSDMLENLLNYDSSQWYIVGDESLLGRIATRIEGNCSVTVGGREDFRITSFEYLVDKETGIVLNSKYFDKNKKILIFKKFLDIKINQNVNPKIDVNFDNFKKVKLLP